MVLVVLPVAVTSGCRSPVANHARDEAAAESQSATRLASPYTRAVATKVSGVVGGYNPQLILTPRQVDGLAALLPGLGQPPQAHTDTAIAGPPSFIVVFDRVSGPPLEVWLYEGVSDTAVALLNAAFDARD